MSRRVLMFLVMGLGPSAFLFMLHDGCRYGMNPLCFYFCLSPVLLCLPMLCFDFDN